MKQRDVQGSSGGRESKGNHGTPDYAPGGGKERPNVEDRPATAVTPPPASAAPLFVSRSDPDPWGLAGIDYHDFFTDEGHHDDPS